VWVDSLPQTLVMREVSRAESLRVAMVVPFLVSLPHETQLRCLRKKEPTAMVYHDQLHWSKSLAELLFLAIATP